MATTLRQGVDIVNESLHTLGYDYQIDVTDNDTMTAGLEKIGAYPPSQRNAIMEQMNLIIQQRNYGVMFNSEKNKFRNFIVDMTPEGFGIEDIFHELIEPVEALWDKQGTPQEVLENLVSYDENKIHKTFHTNKYESQFKSTVDRRNYEKVFTAYGITRYVDTKLANLSWSAEHYFMNVVVDIIKSMISDKKIKTSYTHGINTVHGITNMVENIKATIAGFLTPSNQFNIGVPDGTQTNGYRPVINMTDSESDVFIVTTPELMARLKVQGYSNAFNLSQYELEGRIIYCPAGTDLGEDELGNPVYFVALDRRAVLIGIKHWLGSSFFVPNVHIVNHWLTIEGIKGYNTWFNAVAFSSDAIDEVEKKSDGATLIISNSSSATANLNVPFGDYERTTQTTLEDTTVTSYDVFGNTVVIDFSDTISVSVAINGTTIANGSTDYFTIPIVPNASIVVNAY